MKKKWLVFPYIIWMVIFTVLPLLFIGYNALTKNADGQLIFTFDNIKEAFDSINIALILKSLKMAAICTVVCLLLAYPLALILSSKRYKDKPLTQFLFVLPMWVNLLLRTYAWRIILQPIGLLYTDFAVILGMVYDFLPFMIFPLNTVLSKINPRVIEAAQDLGANKLNVFGKVILPLSLPGIISGIVMVFIPAVSTFVVSKLLGGGGYRLIGDLIELYFKTEGGNNMGSAVSLVLVAIILISMFILNRFDKDHEGGTLV